MAQNSRLQERNDTAANFALGNLVLLVAERGYETDTKKRKTGDGVTPWNLLAYDASSTAGPVGSTLVPFGDTITLNGDTYSNDHPITVSETFSIAANPVPGSTYTVRLIAQAGAVAPSFSGLTLLPHSDPFNLTAGRITTLSVGFIGAKPYALFTDTGETFGAPVYAPNAPSIAVAGIPTSSQISFTITPGAVDSLHSAASTYQINSRIAGSGNPFFQGPASSALANAPGGLLPNTSYEFQPVANNAAGSSAAGASVTVSTTAGATSSSLSIAEVANVSTNFNTDNYLDWAVQAKYDPFVWFAKHAAGAFIGAQTVPAGGGNSGTAGNPATLSWTEQGGGTNQQGNGSGTGYSLVAGSATPAAYSIPITLDQTTRKVRVYLRAISYAAGRYAKVRASLSDGSVPPVDLQFDSQAPEGEYRTAEITVHSGAAGQSMVISLESDPAATAQVGLFGIGVL